MQLGVSVRRTYGWTPAEITSHEYDAEGRVIRTVVRAEPEFSAWDINLMLAYNAFEADKGPHGIPMSRATDPKARFRADPIPTHDKAQKALSKAQKKYYDANPDADRAGDLWHVDELTE
jgi:hypothetical protein